MEVSGHSDEAPVYQDRSRRLRGLGVFLIVIGAFHLLQAALTLLSVLFLSLTAAAATSVSPFSLVSPAFSVWSTALSMTLGVGALRARRWVRPLILIRSWYSVGVTVLTIPMVAMVMKPSLFTASESQPQEFQKLAYGIVVVVIVFVFAIKTGVSALFIWGFQPEDVRLTCEARNPSPSWTDRLPIPVLGWCIYMVFMMVFWFVTPLVSDVAYFGFVVPGIAGVAFGWLICGIYAAVLRELVRRRMAGWVGSVVLSALLHTSGAVSLMRLGFAGLLAHMRLPFPQEQLKPVLQLGSTFDWIIASYTLLFGVASLAFLFWIRPYFAWNRHLENLDSGVAADGQ